MRQTNYDKIQEEIEDLAENITLDDISNKDVDVFFKSVDTEDYIGEILDILEIHNLSSKFKSEVTNVRFVDEGLLIKFSCCLDEERELLEFVETKTDWDREDRLYHEAKDRSIEE